MTAPVTALARALGNMQLTQAPHRPSWRDPRSPADGWCELRTAVHVQSWVSITLTEAPPVPPASPA